MDDYEESRDKNCFFDDEERKHFCQVIKTFQNYGNYMKKRINNSLNNFKELNERHKNLVPDFENNCKEMIKCVNKNSSIIDMILLFIENMFVNQEINNDFENNEELNEYFENERVLTTLKQIARDWSEFGVEERKACYEPIINDLISLYQKSDVSEVSVLVPGAGLGRLAFEIANIGFRCEGNEFSLYMLMASNFILNKCDKENEYEIYPWIHQSSNNMSIKDQLCGIKFPDISPIKISSDNQFSMAAGDFLEIYYQPDSWNSIVTCYFIDTARNILDYIDKIYQLLKPGGYWINFGPLLYHFADIKNEKSIELSYEQVKYAIENVGFKYIKEESRVKSSYTENKNSMYRYTYDCVHFICQKPIN